MPSPPPREEPVPGLQYTHIGLFAGGDTAEQVRAGPTDAVPFRPANQLPILELYLFDPDGQTAEAVRVRGDRAVIGRTDGDVRIPHDPMVSARHAELTREPVGDGHQWVLTDLGTTNGTFVRMREAALRPGQELLIGGGRYRFELPTPGRAGERAADEPQTMGWQAVRSAELYPYLVELTPDGVGQRFRLSAGDGWVGRDPVACAVLLGHDPMVSPRHARVFADPDGGWHVEDGGSLNGVWLRADRTLLGGGAMFQLGEQRFTVRVSG